MISAGHNEAWPLAIDASDTPLTQTLSAFMDGEEESVDIDSDPLVARHHWATYHLIGEALREPTTLAPVTTTFASRMSAALEREVVHGQLTYEPPPKPSRRRVASWRQALSTWPGFAVAAAVASVVWIAQPLLGPEQATVSTTSVTQAEPASRSVNSQELEQARPEWDYVSAHRQMAGPIAVRQVAFTPGANE